MEETIRFKCGCSMAEELAEFLVSKGHEACCAGNNILVSCGGKAVTLAADRRQVCEWLANNKGE